MKGQNMKRSWRWVGWCAVAAALVLIAAYAILPGSTPAAENDPIIVQYTGDRLRLAKSPSELWDASDLIVVAQIAAPGIDRYHYFPGTDNIIVGYMETDLIVEEVLKGALSPEETVTITEECYTTEGGTVLVTQDGYLPAQPGTRYLFFLSAYDGGDYDGMYFPVDLEYGRYVLPEEALSSGGMDSLSEAERRELLQIGPDGEIDVYCRWYAEVLGTYITEP